MMNDPSFMKEMLAQLKDPSFISQMKASLSSPEARAAMEKMGMRTPSEEEIREAMAKLESPEFQAQLRERAERMQAAMSSYYEQQPGDAEPQSKFGGSRLANSKVDASGRQSDTLNTPVLGSA